jgi:hypothetical protein
VIRDPVVLAIYGIAIKARIFPYTGFVRVLLALTGLSLLAAFVSTFNTPYSNVIVTFFGLRSNFLHLPLIFILPVVFTEQDVLKYGKIMLIVAVPMAVLMTLQYRAGPSDFLNATAGGEGKQLDSWGGKIRPAGTFSFVTGAVQFYALVAAFFVYETLKNGVFSPLVLMSGASLGCAMAVSGSRSLIYSAAIVFVMLPVCAFFNRVFIVHTLRLAILGVCFAVVLAQFSFFDEALNTTTQRIQAANQNEDFLGRYFGEFASPFLIIADVPLLGFGLGIGTNAGASLITGKITFLLSEGEWARAVLESGPFLGLGYLFLRVALVVGMFSRGVGLASRGRCLPLLLLGASGLLLVNGQFGQSTTVGFAVFGGGLCLASCNTVNESSSA